MARWLGALILFWPLLEIAGLVWLAERIGLAATLALTGAGFLAGLFVLRQTGLQAVQRLRLAIEMGDEPGHTLIDAACFAIAGILLIVPGPISDIVAVALMLPWTRDCLLRWVARHFQARNVRHHPIVTGDHKDIDDRPPTRHPGPERPIIDVGED